MFVFLTMLTLYPDGRLTGFAKATKTSGAAKVYWRQLNSHPVLELTSEYFERLKKKKCRHKHYYHTVKPPLSVPLIVTEKQ